MNRLDFSNDHYMSMAVQTILVRHRSRLSSSFDPTKDSAFIKEMSEQILLQADRFKQITESTLRDLNISDYDHS